MRRHKHEFRLHIGIKVFGGIATAWVRGDLLGPPTTEEVTMWRCVECGEQGYEIPVAA